VKRIIIFLITAALIAGMVGCVPAQYNLTISSTEGGGVTTPGEGTFTYDEGEVVNLMAAEDAGYRFVNWTGDVDDIANVEDATTTITMNDDYSITADFAVKQYDLTISSTEGGSVTTPGEGTFTYDYGTVVNLVAEAEEGYHFVNWMGDVATIGNVNAAITSITMHGHYSITADFAMEICDWYDLDAIRDNLGGSYVLMNDLDSTTAGYAELAATTANGGKGWEPIGSLFVDPFPFGIVDPVPYTGVFNGQGYEIRDLFIGRPDEDGVGLFGCVGEGVIENLGVVNAEVTGRVYVGGLVGENGGTVSNSSSAGNVTGEWDVGGLVGENDGTVSNSYSSGGVTGEWYVGGLVGENDDTVSNSCSAGSVTGYNTVGGLVGGDWGTVSSSYSTGNVTGAGSVGGLVGVNHDGTVSNSYYSYDEVLINGRNIITIGALSDEDFEQWLANDKVLDINEGLSQEDGYYLINDVNDFKSLLAFGQDGALKFRLENELDLGDEPNFYIPYLAGEFDGNGRKIANLSFSFDFISQVGLFGYLASGGAVTGVNAENVNITGDGIVGGLVGQNDGIVSNSYSTGTVTGGSSVGGLVGWNEDHATVSHSYSAGIVTGRWDVGGLTGGNGGIVRKSYATSSVTGIGIVGGLVGWNDGGIVSDSYSTGDVTGDLHIGGLVGWNNGSVSNSFSSGSVTEKSYSGGLVGDNQGTVSSSFWDIETSGQATSAGGTGKTTAEMHDIATFTGAAWDIITVAHEETNPAYTWNIVDGETYPFLSWQSMP